MSERITLSPTLEPLEDLDRIHGIPPQLHVRPHSFSVAVNELENADGAVLLTIHRTAHVQNVLEIIDLDGAVHAEVRTLSGRLRPVEAHVHRHRAVHDGGIDSNHVALRHAVVRVD